MSKKILIIDDDIDILNIYKACFKNMDYIIDTAGDGAEGLEKVRGFNPDMIILDINMPKMNGYEFCINLKKQAGDITIPIIFASAEKENDQLNAFTFGVVDYLIKPFRKTDLYSVIEKNLETGNKWKKMLFAADEAGLGGKQADISGFIPFFTDKLKMEQADKEKMKGVKFPELYRSAENLCILPETTAECLAEFFNMQYFPVVDPEALVLGFMPVAFLQKNRVVAVKDSSGTLLFVTAEPYNTWLIEFLKSIADYKFAVTEPENIDQLFDKSMDISGVKIEGAPAAKTQVYSRLEFAGIVKLANIILSKAFRYKAEKVSIKLKNNSAEIKIDDKLNFQVKARTGDMLIFRCKIASGLELLEENKIQSGSFSAGFRGRRYDIKVTVNPKPEGEECLMEISE